MVAAPEGHAVGSGRETVFTSRELAHKYRAVAKRPDVLLPDEPTGIWSVIRLIHHFAPRRPRRQNLPRQADGDTDDDLHASIQLQGFNFGGDLDDVDHGDAH